MLINDQYNFWVKQFLNYLHQNNIGGIFWLNELKGYLNDDITIQMLFKLTDES